MGDEIAKKKSNVIAIPEHIKESMNGVENIGVSHITLPRCNIVQGLSKAHTEDNVPLGHFVNSITGEDYGESFDFICLVFVPGITKYDKDKNLIARKFADNFLRPIDEHLIKDGDTEFHGNEKPAAYETYLYVGFVNGKGPVAFSLKSTALMEGKKLNTMLMEDDRASYAKHYKVKSRKESNDKGTWWVMEFKPDGWLKPEEYTKAEAGFKKITKKETKIEVDLSDKEQPAGKGESKENPAPKKDEPF